MKKIILIIIAAVVFIFPDEISSFAYSSLNVCFTNVIPILFPLSVISSMLISEGLEFSLIPLYKLFGLSKKSNVTLISGKLFGFPIGAKNASRLYKRGIISKEEAEILIACSADCSLLFLYITVGKGFFKSSTGGIILYSVQLISSVISGITVNRFIFKPSFNKDEAYSAKISNNKVGFVEGVKSASDSVVCICGFITAFGVICGIIQLIFKASPIGGILISVTEITSAARLSLYYGAYGEIMCGFAAGFTGLSAISQAAYFARENGLSVKRLIITKLISGIISGIIFPFFYKFPVSEAAALSAYSPAFSYISGFVVLLFALKGIKIKKDLDLRI